MADGFNRVMLFGNLGMDPELRMTAGGAAVLKMRLATSESYLDRNKERRERTEWHNVVVWGKRAEALGKFLSKGSKLFVEGSLRTSSYEDRDGNKRHRTEIVATNIVLAGSRGSGGGQRGVSAEQESGSPGSGYGEDDYGVDDDIPF